MILSGLELVVLGMCIFAFGVLTGCALSQENRR